MAGRLDSKIAFVVGASSGIGRGVAEAFAEEGATVIVGSSRISPREGGQPTHELIQQEGGDAAFVTCDLTDQKSVDTAIESAVDEYGKLDIGFNSAGTLTRSLITDTDENDLQMVMEVNLLGAMRFAKGILPALADTDGTLLTISSEAAERGIGNLPVYCASKGGVNAFTRALAVGHGPDGVNVNAIAPGTTKTAINKQVREENPEWVEERRSDIPIRMLNEPEDIAHLAVFLASDEANKINGTIVNIDGGSTIT